MEGTAKENHVVVVGAGIAGLVSTVTMAEEYLREQQQQQRGNASEDHSHEHERPGRRPPLTISLLEAHPFVGGRIRTVVTDNDADNDTDDDADRAWGGASRLLFRGDRLPDSRRAEGFAPWPVPIGAEFVHGVDSMANELIEDHEEWRVHETFNLCASSEEYPSDNSFVRRRSSLALSEEQQSAPHTHVFLNGECVPLQQNPGHHYGTVARRGDEENEASGDHNATQQQQQQQQQQRLIRNTNRIWQALQSIGEEMDETKTLCGGVTHNRDMSLDEFVEDLLSSGEEDLDPEQIETVKQLLESLYSNTAGTSNKFLGIHEASREEWNWEYTESNFRTERCFQEFVRYYVERIAEINRQAESSFAVRINIEVACPVTEIGGGVGIGVGVGFDEASAEEDEDEEATVPRGPIRVSTRTGKTLVCDRCIVAVPLGVLKADTIAFRDAYRIPREMREAIDTIHVFSGMKAHMLLRVGTDIAGISEFLKRTELVFCPGEIYSQVWLRRDEDTVFLTGFCVANCRDRLMEEVVANCGNEGTTGEAGAAHSDSKSAVARGLMLEQVDRMFGARHGGDTVFLDPSSPTCSSFALHDWSDDEFAMGIYSSPSVGAGWVDTRNENETGDGTGEDASGTIATDDETSGAGPPPTHRDYLARPIRNRIWLAGEHANTTTCATVQSAMESGAKAAREAYRSLTSMR